MPAGNLKVLVIDDDKLIRAACLNVLKKINVTVIEANNGITGIAAYKKETPDLVITDILMPDKEGLETISEIRTLNPNAKIIAMSGGGTTHNMTFLQLAQKIGANRILSKPFKPEELLTHIKSLFSE